MHPVHQLRAKPFSLVTAYAWWDVGLAPSKRQGAEHDIAVTPIEEASSDWEADWIDLGGEG